MKCRVCTMLFVITMMATVLSGCSNSNQDTVTDNADGTKKLKIVCTIFPEYDWVKQILGEQANQADLTLLLKNGVDLHSFQPTAQDIVKISDADLFIYVGGESDAWVKDALKSTNNPNRVVINLMEILENQIKEEEIVEGMQEEEYAHDSKADHEGEEHEGEDHEDHEHEGVVYDEHVWLSLKNAEIICKEITQTIKELNRKNADSYQANCDAYIDRLKELDDKYIAMTQTAKRTTILCGDRFPFRYMMDDYGLTYYAAFVGCSAETEASFETITFLSKKTDELSLPVVFTIERSNRKLAETIVENTAEKNQEVLELDSMQSVTNDDIKAGESYLAIMQKNYEALEKALN